MLAAHAIGGHHDARPLRAALAVDEHFLVRVRAEQLEELHDLRDARVVRTAPGDAQILHPLCLNEDLLPGDFSGVVPQIHDDIDPHLLQLFKAHRVWLSAPRELWTDRAEVRETGKLHARRRGRRVRRSSPRVRDPGQNCRCPRQQEQRHDSELRL